MDKLELPLDSLCRARHSFESGSIWQSTPWSPATETPPPTNCYFTCQEPPHLHQNPGRTTQCLGITATDCSRTPHSSKYSWSRAFTSDGTPHLSFTQTIQGLKWYVSKHSRRTAYRNLRIQDWRRASSVLNEPSRHALFNSTRKKYGFLFFLFLLFFFLLAIYSTFLIYYS